MVHSVIVNHEGKRYECTFVVNVAHLANYLPVRKAFARAIKGAQREPARACHHGVEVIEVKPLDP